MDILNKFSTKSIALDDIHYPSVKFTSEMWVQAFALKFNLSKYISHSDIH